MATAQQAREIHERLKPTHLGEEIGPDSELKDQVDEVAKTDEDPPEPKVEDPRSHKEYPFKFEYKDARGNIWKGAFQNKILTIEERRRVGILRAQLNGTLPIESLDALTAEINLMIAHLTYSLIERPKWAENLRVIEDFQIVQNLYGEVASHEAYFLGWDSASRGSDSESGERSSED